MMEKKDHCLRKLVEIAYMLDSLTLFCPSSFGHNSVAVFCSSEKLHIKHVLSQLAIVEPISVELVRLTGCIEFVECSLVIVISPRIVIVTNHSSPFCLSIKTYLGNECTVLLRR